MDIHCRCVTINVVEGIPPSIRRDNETGRVIPYKNYNDWYENRVVGEQLEM